MNRLVVCCHDAGGAEIVSSWVKRHQDEWDISLLLMGPATKIFERKLGRSGGPFTFEPDFVLCGSGLSGWERNAIDIARTLDVPCAAYLDHWKNYRARFGEHLPDQFWVADEYADAMAKRIFPDAEVVNKGNPYLEDFVAEVEETDVDEWSPSGLERILWIDEPDYRERFRDWERTAASRALVRLHPTAYDSPAAYEAATDAYGPVGAILSDPKVSLAYDVARSDVVVGGDSMALVAALYAGKRVVSVLRASEASIPYPGIERP